MIIIDKEICNRDGVCIAVCPVGAITRDEDGSYSIDPDACIECNTCLTICSQSAIFEE